MNCSNETANIEPPINETLGFGAALCIPYIDPDEGYVQLVRYLNDSWFRGQDNIIEDVVALQNFFYIVRR